MLPRRLAYEIADREWYGEQLATLHNASATKQTDTIPLTCKTSKVRLGGGFVIMTPTALLVPQRSRSAPTMPLAFAEASGVFDTHWKSPYEMLSGESVEVLIVDGHDILCIPCFPPPLDRCNDLVQREAQCLAEAALERDVHDAREVEVEYVCLRNSITLKYGDLPPIDVAMSAEIETSSLELIGAMAYPKIEACRYFDGELYEVNDTRMPAHREIHEIGLDADYDRVWKKGSLVRRSTLDLELGAVGHQLIGQSPVTTKLQEVLRGLPSIPSHLEALLKF